MNKQTHSAEPWQVLRERPATGGRAWDLVDADGAVIGVLHARSDSGAAGYLDDDMHRIVAYVNGCEGVGSPTTAVDLARDALGGALAWLTELSRRASERGWLEDLVATRPEGLYLDKMQEAKDALGLSAGERLALELMNKQEEKLHDR